MSSRFDPRILQIALLTAYLVVGKAVYSFQVSWWQVGISLVTCVMTEWVLTKVAGERLTWPLSALISGLGIALALRASGLTPFLIAGLVAMMLKRWLRYRGRHIFNPSNSGIAIATLILPYAVATAPLQWGYNSLVLVLMSIFGAYLVYTVQRLPVIASFLAVFVALQEIRHVLWPLSLNASFNEFMWGSLFVFTFNMITDPKTSPSAWRMQIIYGWMIAILSQTFLALEVHNAVYLSLAAVCLFQFLWRFAGDRGTKIRLST